jgi:hypothetical protein
LFVKCEIHKRGVIFTTYTLHVKAMQLQINYNWQQAKRGKFNVDSIRTNGKRVVLSKQLKERRVVVQHSYAAVDVQEWLKDNEIEANEYEMFGVFDDRVDLGKMFFVGLAFHFTDSMTAMYFKLRFS